MTDSGLDHAFLQYTGYSPEIQKAHQGFYLPFFAECKRVVDLGCGNGDFVELLLERGIGAIGVDADSASAQYLRDRGIPVAHQDVFAYLDQVANGSIDGVYAGHLVEHLPYDKVIELVRLAYRALEPGGTIVLTTPDPRSLYAHLEMFYLHFGHVTFYHPRLLAFFLEYVGFVDPVFASTGSAIQPRSPLFGVSQLHRIQAELPAWKVGILRRVLRLVRMAVASVFLDPYLNLIQSNFEQLANALQRVDRPFECYVKAIKPHSATETDRESAVS